MQKYMFRGDHLVFFVLICMAVVALPVQVAGQANQDQNGLRTSVTQAFSADKTQAIRYEIAAVGYNSHHWQHSGSIILELFNTYFGTGYEKYHISIGYQAGTGATSPKAELIESRGTLHNARLTLGTPYELSTTYAGYINKGVPIFLDVRHYSAYKVKLTYTGNLVNELTSHAQIVIHDNPTGTDIPDFSVDTLLLDQVNRDHNGLRTSVTQALRADKIQAKRYEIATVGYNSHHWQYSGSLILELFNTYFGTGYEKYHISIGYQAGTGATSPKAELIESRGTLHNARITLGTPYELSTTYAGYINKGIPIFLDVRHYSAYKVKLTYTGNLVNELTSHAQIVIHDNPTGTDIPDFSVDTLLLDQVNRDHNGLRTSVTQALSADKIQAKRYEIATVGYNSHHWQYSGSLILELFNTYFGTGYEKYHISIGYQAGTGATSPKAELVESRGTLHNARITLGTPYELSTTYAGYINKGISIFLDVRHYSAYKVKLTYTGNLVNELTSHAQVFIHDNPTGADIPDFSLDRTIIVNDSNATVKGNAYVTGRLGIGTTNPQTELAVNGTITSKEVKVTVDGWSDFVFQDNYQLPSIDYVAAYIDEHKHLPGVPSAKEIKNDGLSIAAMLSNQMQKIEELTLYLIEQNREIERLKQEIAQLKKTP